MPLARSSPSTRAAALAIACAACVRGGVAPELAADPERLLEEVRARQQLVERVRGTARVRIDSPDAKGTLAELVVAEKPSRVRLETLDFFGSPAAWLVADGERFGFYDSRSGTFWRGDATPENVSRFLPVALPPAELVTILCGSAPLLPGHALSAKPRDGRMELVVGRGDVGQRLVLGEKLVVEESRVRRAASDPAAQAVFYDLAFSSFTEFGKYRVPLEARLEAPSARARVELTWQQGLEVNPTLDPKLFEVTPPRGAKVVDLPPGGAPPADVQLPFQTEE